MDISQESDRKSHDEISVLSSYGKNLERPRALLKENVCGRRISSAHTKREVQLRMFASYRSLGLGFLFNFGDKLLRN